MALNPSPVDIPPRPLTVQVTLDQNSAVTALVPTTGGTVQCMAADGTNLLLSVPSGALVEDTTITLTPVTAIDGITLAGGVLLGADLAPDGLRLFQLATLTITPQEVSASTSAYSFSHHTDGSEFHFSPIDADPSQLMFHLGHFSGVTVYLGDNISIPIAPEDFQPTDWEDQVNHWTQDLLRNERNRQLLGQDPDPNFNQNLLALFAEYFNRVLGSMLPRIETDCAFAQINAPKALSFARTLALLGYEDNPMVGAIGDSTQKGFANCYTQSIKPCIDRFNLDQMKTVISYARQNQLLGGDASTFNPWDPSLACPPGVVAVAAHMQASVSGVSQFGDQVTQTMDITFTGAGDGGSIQTVLGKMDLTWTYTSIDKFGDTCQGQALLQGIDLDGTCYLDPDGSIQLNLSTGATSLPIHLPLSCLPGGIDTGAQLSFKGLQPGQNDIDVTSNDLRNYVRAGSIPPDIVDKQHWSIAITEQ